MKLSKDEIEAVGRLARLTPEGSAPEVYGCDPLAVGSKVRADQRTAAEALAREHPASDEEPFTPQWLEQFEAKGEFSFFYPTDGIGETVIALSKRWYTRVPPGSTVGDVRRFLAWQGVALCPRS